MTDVEELEVLSTQIEAERQTAAEQLQKLQLEVDKARDERAARKAELDRHVQELEDERQAKLQEIEDERTAEWRELRMNIPEHTDRKAIEHKLHELYKAMKWKVPDYVLYVPSPPYFARLGVGNWQGDKVAHRMRQLESLVEPAKTNQDPFRVLYTDSTRILHRVPRVYEEANAKLLQALTSDILDFVPAINENRAVVLEKPLKVSLTTTRRFHATDGPAVIWGDGYREWWFNGVKVSRDLLEGDVTVGKILRERNVERRRLLLERYGEERYLKERKAELIKEDKHGKLWRIPGRSIRNSWGGNRTGEEEVYVEVQNATPEPDGTTRTFFLRVPPFTRTPKEAVAWTFSRDSKEYKPKKET